MAVMSVARTSVREEDIQQKFTQQKLLTKVLKIYINSLKFFTNKILQKFKKFTNILWECKTFPQNFHKIISVNVIWKKLLKFKICLKFRIF